MEHVHTQCVENGLIPNPHRVSTRGDVVSEAIEYAKEKEGPVELFVVGGIRFMVKPDSEHGTLVKAWSEQVRPVQGDIS